VLLAGLPTTSTLTLAARDASERPALRRESLAVRLEEVLLSMPDRAGARDQQRDLRRP